MNPVERFRRTAGVTSVENSTLSDFIAAPSPGLLVVLGDPSRRPEATDVAVVMREVAQASPGLRVGVVVDEAAGAARAQLGAQKEPVVAVLVDGAVTQLLEGMQDWGVYAAVVRELSPDGVAEGRGGRDGA